MATVHSVRINTATNDVVSPRIGSELPVGAAPNEGYVQVTEAEYKTINDAGMKYPDNGPAKWKNDAGTIVPQADPRAQLEITLDKTEALAGETITFDFQARDVAGVPITPTAVAKITIEGPDATRFGRVNLSGGTRQVVRAFTRTGRYRIGSGDPAFKIVGASTFNGRVLFEVAEDF